MIELKLRTEFEGVPCLQHIVVLVLLHFLGNEVQIPYAGIEDDA